MEWAPALDQELGLDWELRLSEQGLLMLLPMSLPGLGQLQPGPTG